MESSFLELRCKEVINIVDGKKLGHIVDVAFDLATCRLLGVIVPGEKTFWNAFKGSQELFISVSQIVKIGADCLLVEIFGGGGQNAYVLSDKKK